VTARRAVVKGRVQGVGFRWFAERTARELGVRGWVRNLDDGSVETVAEGNDAAVAAYLARLEKGPHGSRVDAVAIEEASETGFSRFDITR
jgi:acylphosphatase